MHSHIASEIWSELQRFIGGGTDRSEAADVLVSVLINNDEHAEDIKQHFKGDRAIMAALAEHLNDDIDEDDAYEEEDEEDW